MSSQLIHTTFGRSAASNCGARTSMATIEKIDDFINDLPLPLLSKEKFLTKFTLSLANLEPQRLHKDARLVANPGFVRCQQRLRRWVHLYCSRPGILVPGLQPWNALHWRLLPPATISRGRSLESSVFRGWSLGTRTSIRTA